MYIGSPDNRPFFGMEKNRIQNLKFHVRSEDYFGTLATILDLFRLDVLEKKFIFDKDKLLKRIVKDLKFLQANYKIVKKHDKRKKQN